MVLIMPFFWQAEIEDWLLRIGDFNEVNPQNYMKRKATRSLPLTGSAYSAISA